MEKQPQLFLTRFASIMLASVLSVFCLSLSACSKNTYMRLLESDVRAALGKDNGKGLHFTDITRILGEPHEKNTTTGSASPVKYWMYWDFPKPEVNISTQKPRSVAVFFENDLVTDVWYGY